MNENHEEFGSVFRAIVTDMIGGKETLESWTFSADSIETAREMAWHRAGRKWYGDVFVNVERLSK